MAYVLDILILAILAFCLWRGLKKGFIAAAFGILTFFIAAALSFMFYTSFSDFVVKTPVGQNVQASINESVYKSVSGLMIDEEQGMANTEDLIENLKLPEFLRGPVYSGSEFLIRNTQQTAAQAVSASLSGMIMNIACGLLLFILLLIGLWILRIILELVFKLPLLHGINKLAGAVAGLINGMLISYLVLAVVGFVASLPAMDWIAQFTSPSFAYSYLYQNNIIMNMFTK